tara:strand:- start:4308 stop:4979 length:672 start_codon:yes stop_codon:yes gene_type:complete
MPTIRPDLDMYASNSVAEWSRVRGLSGSSFDSNNVKDAFATSVQLATKGGATFIIRRSMFVYDTSSITSDVASASIDVTGYSQSSADIILVKAVFVGGIGAGYFDDFKGTSAATALSNSDGSGAGTLASAGIDYSSEVATWNTSGVNQISLNATALADIKGEDDLMIIMMEYDHDYLDIEYPSAGYKAVGLWWDESGGTNSPKLNYTLATASTDNAIFFGANF